MKNIINYKFYMDKNSNHQNQEKLNKSINLFFVPFKGYWEEKFKDKWGNQWIEKVMEFNDRIIKDNNGNPKFDLNNLTFILSQREVREILKIDNIRKNKLNIVLEYRNRAYHNQSIEEEELMDAVNNMLDLCKDFKNPPIEELRSFIKTKSENNQNETNRNNEDNILSIDPFIQKTPSSNISIAGPFLLEKVFEGQRGKNKAIILKFRERPDLEVACNFENDYNQRLKNCLSLINQYVYIESVGNKFDFENGWFKEIYIGFPFQKTYSLPNRQPTIKPPNEIIDPHNPLEIKDYIISPNQQSISDNITNQNDFEHKEKSNEQYNDEKRDLQKLVTRTEIEKRENATIYNMLFRKDTYSIFLLNHDQDWIDEKLKEGFISYEGHDNNELDRSTRKLNDQIMTWYGNLAPNGEFYNAAKEFENGKIEKPYPVKVYEKPHFKDLWTDLGIYGLVKVDYELDRPGRRKAFKFLLSPNFEYNNLKHPQDDKEIPRSRLIPREVKILVMKRDNGKCSECENEKDLQFDHIIPFSQGGSNNEQNIQILCSSCNMKKGNKIQ